MKKVVGLLVVLLAIFLAGTMVMANEQLDRDFVKLRVYIGPYAQIQLDNDGYISIELNKPGESKRGTVRFDLYTNTGVVLRFPDPFPRLTLEGGGRSFKDDPTSGLWDNALKSKVWFSNSSNGQPWNLGTGDGQGQDLPLSAGKHTKFVTLEAHWDDRPIVNPGWLLIVNRIDPPYANKIDPPESNNCELVVM